MFLNIKKRIKIVAYFLAIDMLIGILYPSVNSIYALTSGPSSPEFSSFEPVATTNLVDPLTGAFTYNLPVIQIPGPDGGGYALSLSHHSGASAEEEASWVGYGWTLNPGAINRNVRGYADEYNGTAVDFYNKTRPNWSMSGAAKLNLEIFSQNQDAGGSGNSGGSSSSDGDNSYNSALNLGVSKYVRFNNYQGLAKTITFSASTAFGGLSMNRSATGVTFSANINPQGIVYKALEDTKKEEKKAREKYIETDDRYSKDNYKATLKKELLSLAANTYNGSFFGLTTFTDVGQSVSLSKVKGFNFNISFGTELTPSPVPIGIEGGLLGTFSVEATKPYESLPVYGYLNTPSGMGDYKADYFTEKAQPFDRRDYFIGIPFSTPDNYMLTGEGLSGGFRPYRNEVGHYSPEEVDGDETNIGRYGIGVELQIGGNVGVGVNLAFGNASSKLREWERTGNTNNEEFNFNDTSSHFYRFNGDLGSKVEYGNAELAKAKLTANPNFPGVTSVFPRLLEEEVSDIDENDAKPSAIITKEDKGFKIYNEAGLGYHYTESTFIKNNTNLSIDIKDNDRVYKNYLAYKNLYLNQDYDVTECDHNVLIGQVDKEPYEFTSLLKLITNPNYIDVGNNGPDNNDFGGWTSFEYFKKYGDQNDSGTNNWYRWRIPYNGLLYSKNSISDVKDDTGFVTTGEKEVSYLKKIETKTHVAYFVTNKSTPDRFGLTQANEESQYLIGTGVDRFDGLAAPNLGLTEDPAAVSQESKNLIDKLEYLEKIVLFSKARPEAPLQITNFEYDYSLVQNLPNNVNGNYPLNNKSPESGKLTLKKVWSEFEGVVSARTSSYKFEYRYKDFEDYPGYLVNENESLQDFFNLSKRFSVNAQNPEYNPYALDAWGCNQYDGSRRHLNLITWPYQGNIPEKSFDPAAWQLKQIKLPSGGEILIEYEDIDYSYVQDREVMSLVSLNNDFNDGYDNASPSYTLNLSDIGYDPDENVEEIQALYERLRSYFLEEYQETNIPANISETIKTDNRIYFKFLYALEGNIPELENCKSEYLTGYAKVGDVILEANNTIRIVIDGTSDGKNLIGIGLVDEPVEDQGYKLTPRQGCYDFYVTQRWGKLSAGCEGEYERKYESEIEDLVGCGDGTIINSIGEAVDVAGFAIDGVEALAGAAGNLKYPRKSKVCMTLNPQLSYLKIPMNKAKRGGGIRVKRILMYDKGIETGDAAIYGQVYRYELEDGTSSGVATNEPQGMREENPLVSFLPKKNQSWLNRLVMGKDKEQSEGPIGETLLPSPSVAHSRVVVENIHNGKTGSGYTIHEFFTTKDYPFDKTYDYSLDKEVNNNYDFANTNSANGVDYSVLQSDSYDDKLTVPASVFSFSLDKSWASQGFRFIINGMNGKPKSVRTYGGTYVNGRDSFISSGQDFHYYEPGEKILMLQEDGTYKYDTPGKEMDVTMERYSVRNVDLDFQFEIDVSVGLMFPPPIFGSGALQFAYNGSILSKYAVSKVIRYPAITKKTVSYSDNIASTSENIGFDYGTGKPILTKTYDAYHNIPYNEGRHDGSIYSLSLPAHWYYPGMGKKSVTSENTNQLSANTGQIITYGKDANPINDDLTWNIKTNKVVSASANTFNTLAGITSWIDDNIHSEYNSSAHQQELEKIWHLHESYVYKEDVKKSSDRITNNGKIFEGGIMNSFVPYDYTTTTQDDKWVMLNEVTKYSPNGNPLEEKDVLGVYSASKYGYNSTQPIIVSKNASYNEIFFEHYEDKASLEPGIVSGIAHSGIYSKKIDASYSLLKNVVAANLTANEGAWLNFWLKSDQDDNMLDLSLDVNGISLTPEKVAKTGEWSLYRAFVLPAALNANQAVQATLNLGNPGNTYIDDIKFQPKETKSTCFVYDIKSLRLITMFDDQHFGMYYQYNDEGQLVRKLIETERGVKVITETQYNLPRENQ